MMRDAWRSEAPEIETCSPPCSLGEVDLAYSGLDADTLGRARWRTRRMRRPISRRDAFASAARRERAVRLAAL